MSMNLTKLLRGENRAVSGVIGALFIFAILVFAFSGYQATSVPQQNAETELQHYQDVQNDLIVVRNALSRVGQQNQPQFESVRLGTTYRVRTLALNPPDPAGTLRTEGPYEIKLVNATEEKTVETRFLEYRNGYNELDIEPIYYENSVLYLDTEDGERVFFEDQNLVQENDSTVVITALQRDFSRSATGRVTLELYPTEAGDSLPTGEVNVTLPTRLPKEYWRDQIANQVDKFDYNNRPGDVNQVNFTVKDSELEFNTVGIGDVPKKKNSVSDSIPDPVSAPPDEDTELSASLDITSLPGNGKYELNASGSSPSGEINKYRWDFDNDNSIDRTSPSATTTVNNGNKDVDDTGSARVIVVNTDTSPNTTASTTEPYPFDASGNVIVNEGETITRDIDTTGNVDVKEGGEVQGSIDSGGDVTVREGGEVQGSIDSGGDVSIKDGGDVQGSVDADDRVTVADVTDSITAGGNVDVKEGGEVQGSIDSGGDVTVREGGEVQGSIDSGGDVSIKDGGEVQGSIDADGEVNR